MRFWPSCPLRLCCFFTFAMRALSRHPAAHHPEPCLGCASTDKDVGRCFAASLQMPPPRYRHDPCTSTRAVHHPVVRKPWARRSWWKRCVRNSRSSCIWAAARSGWKRDAHPLPPPHSEPGQGTHGKGREQKEEEERRRRQKRWTRTSNIQAATLPARQKKKGVAHDIGIPTLIHGPQLPSYTASFARHFSFLLPLRSPRDHLFPRPHSADLRLKHPTVLRFNSPSLTLAHTRSLAHSLTPSHSHHAAGGLASRLFLHLYVIPTTFESWPSRRPTQEEQLNTFFPCIQLLSRPPTTPTQTFTSEPRGPSVSASTYLHHQHQGAASPGLGHTYSLS